jgi:hypothetical protein
MMKTDIQKKLAERISKDYFLSQENAQVKVLQIYSSCPSQLITNVEQWAKNASLTDIFIGKYSIPMIMAIWGCQDFLSALEVITEYFNGDADAAERRIWQTRR